MFETSIRKHNLASARAAHHGNVNAPLLASCHFNLGQSHNSLIMYDRNPLSFLSMHKRERGHGIRLLSQIGILKVPKIVQLRVSRYLALTASNNNTTAVRQSPVLQAARLCFAINIERPVSINL
ncbi:hypothetical protein K0M31_003744 [Melipona bicolor]|uniref:Uncharacterized protein n=1 Tax=Melipona bicolor TaxID=60889 RepID=A0AA40FY99_9HYME|nr:hypothetical protein K0M31_003744 [Melipona bicolor]